MIYRICLFVCLANTAFGQAVAPPALHGLDALGRAMPGSSAVRTFSPDREVGIFYFLWLNQKRVYDNSLILKGNPLAIQTNASPPWGRKGAFHFWGKPLYGYYRSDDPWVLRRHAALLADAGVDFLVMDTTNGLIYEDVVMRLCEVFAEQQNLGEHVPKITFMVNSSAGKTAQKIYDVLYKPGLYSDLWYRRDGKPFLICDPTEATKEVSEFFTLRKAHWPFEMVNTRNAWHWEATYPQVYSYENDSLKPEQVNVSVGQNLHRETGKVVMMSSGYARGRSFHKGKVDQRPNAYQYGFNFQEQWERAFELDPEVVFITGWNEWIAMQLNRKDQGLPIFCDQYDLELSRDVEMMSGGYGDNYYMQMAANIRGFKGMETPASPCSVKAIDPNASFSQWDEVSTEYRDHALDTLPRDHAGCGENYYRNYTGRNDIRLTKVAHDDRNVSFFVQTSEAISPATDPNWMWLLIDVRGTESVSWEGFEFLVNREGPKDNTVTLERCTGGWQWEQVGSIDYRVAGKQMHFVIPKSMLGIEDSNFELEFKWIDNCQEPGNILDGYTNGDTAPEGRFRYRYKSL